MSQSQPNSISREGINALIDRIGDVADENFEPNDVGGKLMLEVAATLTVMRDALDRAEAELRKMGWRG